MLLVRRRRLGLLLSRREGGGCELVVGSVYLVKEVEEHICGDLGGVESSRSWSWCSKEAYLSATTSYSDA